MDFQPVEWSVVFKSYMKIFKAWAIILMFPSFSHMRTNPKPYLHE